MTSNRRMGSPGSAIWCSMLDSAEEILREEGYAALTSRRVAERLGLKQRLVYYYFQTMEDLIAETFRRLANRELEYLKQAASGSSPLSEIWALCIRAHDARTVAEFSALANRSDALRKEVVHFIEEQRRMQVAVLNKAFQARAIEDGLPAVAAAILATGAALTLHRESGIGVKSGHDQLLQAISKFIKKCEQRPPAPKGGRVPGFAQSLVPNRGVSPRKKKRSLKSRP